MCDPEPTCMHTHTHTHTGQGQESHGAPTDWAWCVCGACLCTSVCMCDWGALLLLYLRCLGIRAHVCPVRLGPGLRTPSRPNPQSSPLPPEPRGGGKGRGCMSGEGRQHGCWSQKHLPESSASPATHS